MNYIVDIDGFPIEIEILPVDKVTFTIYYPPYRYKITSPIEPPLEYIRKTVSPEIERIKLEREISRKRREYHRQWLEKKPWPKTVYVLGKPYQLIFIENTGKQKIEIENESLKMFVRPNSSVEGKWNLLEKYYKELLEEIAYTLLKKWEPIINVTVTKLTIKKVRSYFGRAQVWKILDNSKYVNLSTKLARHSLECIELVVVHELVHLIQKNPGHNNEFYELMQLYLPEFRALDKKLDEESLLF